jgi:hypothetical protein
MDEMDIRGRIKQLMTEEHQLRAGYGRGTVPAEEEHARLGIIQVELDECWDLLRERRDKHELDQAAEK